MANKKIDKEKVVSVLKEVKHPGFSRDIMSLGLVKEINVDGDKIGLTLLYTTQSDAEKAQIEKETREAISSRLEGVAEVIIEGQSGGGGAQPKVRTGMPNKKGVPGVEHIIAVSSGKGGVGKSTVSVNIALALSEKGLNVGIMDADIYGPNIPMMIGTKGHPTQSNQQIVPLISHNVKVISMGFLLPADESPVIWRGPLVSQAVQQLLYQVAWAPLDYLIVDMPPGTGDAQLTLTQSVLLAGGVIVTTPQDVALLDSTKGVKMFETVNTPILGIVENMSFFLCPHCGERTEIFSHGGARKAADKLGVPFLGEVSLDPEIREGGDSGKPIMVANPDSPQSEAFRKITESLIQQVERVEGKE